MNDNCNSRSREYEFIGIVDDEPKTITYGSGYTKKELRVRTDDSDRANHITFEFQKGAVEMLDGVRPDDHVLVTFRLRSFESKKHPGMFFNVLDAVHLQEIKARTNPHDKNDESTMVDMTEPSESEYKKKEPPKEDDSFDIGDMPF